MAPEAKEQTELPPHNPMTGTVCLWYPRANPNEQPRVAIVVGPHPPSRREMLDLAVVVPSTGQFEYVKNVRRIGDPHHEDHPKIAALNGGWDHRKENGQVDMDLSPIVARLVPTLVTRELAPHKKAIAKQLDEVRKAKE